MLGVVLCLYAGCFFPALNYDKCTHIFTKPRFIHTVLSMHVNNCYSFWDKLYLDIFKYFNLLH